LKNIIQYIKLKKLYTSNQLIVELKLILYKNVLFFLPSTPVATTPIITYTQNINANNINNNDLTGTIIVDGISPNASQPAWMIEAAISNCLNIYTKNNIKYNGPNNIPIHHNIWSNTNVCCE